MSFPAEKKYYAGSSHQSSSQGETFPQESAHRGRITSELLPVYAPAASAYFSRKDGIVQQPCSEDFLAVLCVQFCKAQSHQLISTLRELEELEQDQRLEFLAYEIERLLQHPELFPSQPTRVRFLAFLAADSRFQICEAISSLLMQSEMHTMQEMWRKNVSRKDYLEGTRGWENFLLFDAPGLPFSSTRTEPKSMVQLLPPVGARIVGDYEKEEREIVRFVQQVCGLCLYLMFGLAIPADDFEEQPSLRSPGADDNNDRLREYSLQFAVTCSQI